MTNSVWLFNQSNQSSEDTISFIQNKNATPDILCITQKNVYNNLLINYLLHAGYTLVKSKNSYQIYVKNNQFISPLPLERKVG